MFMAGVQQQDNRTDAAGVHTKARVGVNQRLHNTVGMEQPTSNSINNNLTQLLSERLDLWDQQDAAQREGAFHRALFLEQQIRQLSDEIHRALNHQQCSNTPGIDSCWRRA